MDMMNELQKSVLSLLLDQYERSKTYEGENKIAQTFGLSPSRVFPEYEWDFADVDQIRDFENQMKELENKGLILIRRKGQVIRKLEASQDAWPKYYEILNRKDKRARQQEELDFYRSWESNVFPQDHPALNAFAREQQDRLESGKKAAFERAEADNILKLLRFIEENQDDILERELSIAVLGDSKAWEGKYRTKVCGLLRRFGNFEELLSGLNDKESREDKRETEHIILAEYHIFANPSYVYFKGNGEFVFDDGRRLLLAPHMPAAFSTETLKHLKEIHILDQKVMTVENLTSFNRMERENTFFVFLSGYHNSAKQLFLRRIWEGEPGLKWYHFGDIDPDGFYIVEHLKRGTGIDFQPVFMDTACLKKYEAYGKPLEDNDIRKAKAMIQSGLYTEIMEYMLQTGKKLEQEIVSWMEREEK